MVKITDEMKHIKQRRIIQVCARVDKTIKEAI